MSAVLGALRAPRPELAVALLGVGAVGSTLLPMLAARPELRLVGVANSRGQRAAASGIDANNVLHHLPCRAEPRRDTSLLAALGASGARELALIDASASARLAESHADWLADGFHVVSANKLAIGGSNAGFERVQSAIASSGRRYGDSATVGAGLPLLPTMRRLRACGDRVLAIEAVLSGSLSWLLNHFDGRRPFSALLSDARNLGYTEPDPRQDLDGRDVARKLTVLARSAGMPLECAQIEVNGLLADPQPVELADALTRLDEVMAERLASAVRNNNVLRHLAILDSSGSARVGLVEVEAEHPAARLRGCDNLVALTTESYRDQPLVIQGAGAGPRVTAQALLGDLLEILA